MKRDSGILFQSLLSLAFIAFAGLVGFVLLTSVRSPQQAQEPPEPAGDRLALRRRSGHTQRAQQLVVFPNGILTLVKHSRRCGSVAARSPAHLPR